MLRIENPQIDEPLEFEYDSDKGLISGPDTDRVRALVRFAGDTVSLCGTWHAVEVHSAETDPESLALILASFGYSVPEELRQQVPELADELTGVAIS